MDCILDIIVMSGLINKVKSAGLKVAEYLTPVLKVSLLLHSTNLQWKKGKTGKILILKIQTNRYQGSF